MTEAAAHITVTGGAGRAPARRADTQVRPYQGLRASPCPFEVAVRRRRREGARGWS